MSKSLVVNGLTYLFPENRDSPSWGEEITDWATAVTTALQSVTGNGDIIQTAATINNNQTSPVNVTGLVFDTSQIRGAVIDYTVYRVTTGSGATERVEVGTMYAGYKTNANVWEFSIIGSCGPSGVTFSISNTGQVLYVSDNMTGSSYVGTTHFRARALLQ